MKVKKVRAAEADVAADFGMVDLVDLVARRPDDVDAVVADIHREFVFCPFGTAMESWRAGP